MKIKIVNRDYLVFEGNVLYKDDHFYVYSSLIYDNILVISRKDKEYGSMEELPEYIRDIALREVI